MGVNRAVAKIFSTLLTGLALATVEDEADTLVVGEAALVLISRAKSLRTARKGSLDEAVSHRAVDHRKPRVRQLRMHK
jgi:hypothetical protein